MTLANQHPFIDLCRRVSRELGGSVPNISIEISSDIPPSSGLGSGAAVATAIARALYAHDGVLSPPLDTLNTHIYETEKYFHGQPSGIDNAVIVHEKPIFFVKDVEMTPFSVSGELRFLVANSGVKAATRETVAAVRARYEAQPDDTKTRFDRIHEATLAARKAVVSADAVALGPLLTENHDHLRALGVSSPSLDRLVGSAIEAGALGAKLSGAGRGGNMIALVTENSVGPVRAALARAGGTHIFEATLS